MGQISFPRNDFWQQNCSRPYVARSVPILLVYPFVMCVRHSLNELIVLSAVSETLNTKMNWLKNYERIIAIEQLLVWQPVTELDPRAYVPEVCILHCIGAAYGLCSTHFDLLRTCCTICCTASCANNFAIVLKSYSLLKSKVCSEYSASWS